MINFLLWYVSVGFSMWAVFFIKDALSGFKRFANADALAVVRGLCAILIWPYMIWLMEIQ